MACPGGCVCGGGQPFVMRSERSDRSKGLYEAERMLGIRRSDENPIIPSVYNNIIDGREHELLHVSYLK